MRCLVRANAKGIRSITVYLVALITLFVELHCANIIRLRCGCVSNYGGEEGNKLVHISFKKDIRLQCQLITNQTYVMGFVTFDYATFEPTKHHLKFFLQNESVFYYIS